MRTRLRQSRERALEAMLQTRTHAWEEVGLSRQLGRAAARKRARIQVFVLLPLLAARAGLLRPASPSVLDRALDTPVQIAHGGRPIALGWQFARDSAVARARAVPADGPGTAGTVGFLLRLVTIAIAHRRAARRGARPADARRRRRVHGGDLRPGRPADARQPHRRHRAAQRAPVPGRRPRPPAGRQAGRARRGHRQLARAALHDASPRRGRSWSRTASC